MKNPGELKGLGGWLILICFIILLTPPTIIFDVVPTYIEIFAEGTWQNIINVDSLDYSPLLATVIIIEIIYNFLMVLVSAILLYLFIAKNSIFPWVFIVWFGSSLIFLPLDEWLIYIIYPKDPMFDPEILEGYFRELVGAAVWIPYMLKSKRVKATFVETFPKNSVFYKIFNNDE